MLNIVLLLYYVMFYFLLQMSLAALGRRSAGASKAEQGVAGGDPREGAGACAYGARGYSIISGECAAGALFEALGRLFWVARAS